eukprot:743239-Hanusia_phi.AAC.1
MKRCVEDGKFEEEKQEKGAPGQARSRIGSRWFAKSHRRLGRRRTGRQEVGQRGREMCLLQEGEEQATGESGRRRRRGGGAHSFNNTWLLTGISNITLPGHGTDLFSPGRRHTDTMPPCRGIAENLYFRFYSLFVSKASSEQCCPPLVRWQLGLPDVHSGTCPGPVTLDRRAGPGPRGLRHRQPGLSLTPGATD